MVIIGINQKLLTWRTKICNMRDPSDHGGACFGHLFVAEIWQNPRVRQWFLVLTFQVHLSIWKSFLKVLYASPDLDFVHNDDIWALWLPNWHFLNICFALFSLLLLQLKSRSTSCFIEIVALLFCCCTASESIFKPFMWNRICLKRRR